MAYPGDVMNHQTYDKRPENVSICASSSSALLASKGCADMTPMPFMLVDAPTYLLRQELLGSEAIYEVVEEGDEIVTAKVVSAPGLPRGMRVDLLARAARQMERCELPVPPGERQPEVPATDPAPPARRFAAR